MADTTARIRVMQVRPSQSADLAFNMAGIIDRQNYDPSSPVTTGHLNHAVPAFDIAATLYDHLGETLVAVTDPSDPAFPREAGARLKYDSATIATTLMSPPTGGGPARSFLFALRNEALASSLDQMINQRENAFLERYKHAPLIKQAMQKALPAIVARLQNMEGLDQSRFVAVDKAYQDAETAGRAPVVVESVTTSSVSGDYKITTDSTMKNKSLAMLNGAAALISNNLSDLSKVIQVTIDSDVFDETSALEKKVQTQKTPGTLSVTLIRNDPEHTGWVFPQDEFVSQAGNSTTRTIGTQSATTPNQSFLHPRLDNNLSHEQLQVGLLGEEMNQTIASFRVDFMEKILANELAAMDQEARKLQTNFAHTFLISPISGVVTIVYKDLGESVEAGEPVLRIENDDVIFAVGQVLYRGLLRVDQSVTIHIDDLFADGTPLDVPGTIKAIRGHNADNDEWEIVIECVNPVVGGVKALPIYYQFDRDMSSIVIH